MKGGLGRRVAEPPPALADGGGGIAYGDVGGHVHDGAPAGIQHRREQCLDDDGLGDDVGPQLALELLDGELEERHHAARGGVDGVVHQHVGCSPRVDQLAGRRLERSEVQEVRHERQALLPPFLDLLGRLLQAPGQEAALAGVGVVATLADAPRACGDGHVESRLGKGQRSGLADPTAGSGDEDGRHAGARLA